MCHSSTNDSKLKLATRKFVSGPSIQIRRQDKFRETPFIEIGQYVDHVKDYFDILQSKLETTIGISRQC